MKPLGLLLLALATALPATVQAGESAMITYAEPVRHASATYVMDARLQALAQPANASAAAAPEETTAAPEPEEDLEDDADDDTPHAPLALLAGSLQVQNAALLQALETDLRHAERTIAEPAATADARDRAVRKVQADLAQARGALIAPDVARTPAFRAAVLAHLLVSDVGVGDAYEDATRGEPDAYPTARALLRQVHALWSDLEPELGPDERAEVQRALGELQAVMPSPTPPERWRDPEDAEHAALDIVFALERGLRQPLLLRDFKPALDLASRQARAACDAGRTGASALAHEYALAARATYRAQVAATLSTLVPDVAARISAAWPAIDTNGTDDPAGADGACATLQSAFQEAHQALN